MKRANGTGSVASCRETAAARTPSRCPGGSGHVVQELLGYHEKAAGAQWTLEDYRQAQAADTALMLCYTGFRVSEFLQLTRFSCHPEAGGYLQGNRSLL